MNFKKETVDELKEWGKKSEDVMFVGTDDGKYRLSWEEFLEIANFKYDDGYGVQEIPNDLIIYFKDQTYAIRNEYDGSEWWEYRVRKLFNENEDYEKFYLKNNGWEYEIMRGEINNEKNE